MYISITMLTLICVSLMVVFACLVTSVILLVSRNKFNEQIIRYYVEDEHNYIQEIERLRDERNLYKFQESENVWVSESHFVVHTVTAEEDGVLEHEVDFDTDYDDALYEVELMNARGEQIYAVEVKRMAEMTHDITIEKFIKEMESKGIKPEEFNIFDTSKLEDKDNEH